MPTHSSRNNSDPPNDADAIFRPGKPLYPAFEKFSPFRKPDWRWRRAREIVDNRQPISAKTDDAWTRKAAKYLAELAKRRGRLDRTVIRKMPDVAIAHQLSEQDVIRWMAEARLLGEESVADVAQHAGVEPAAIVAFIHLFFDVLDRLECTDFITSACLGTKYHNRQLTMDDKDVLLKMYGYFGGPIFLHYVAPYILHPDIDLSLLSPRHAQLGPKIKRMLALDTTQFTWATDKHSQSYLQMNPPTNEDVQEMMLAAIEKGDGVLRPTKLKRKRPQPEMTQPSEPNDPLCLTQSSGA